MKKKYRRSLSYSQPIVFAMIIILFILTALFFTYQCVKEKPSLPPPPNYDLSEQAPSSTENAHNPRPKEPEEQLEPNHSTRKDSCYTFLVAASDQSSGNADVIMVATYDAINQTVGLVSVPRDTLVDPSSVPSKFPKINSTYYFGIDCLKEVVSNLLGIPIDYYFTLDVSGFVTLVDKIGGIDFDVPVHMSYDDPAQGLSIHFEPGMQHLNGEEALAVCRLRYNQDGTIAYPDYDIGRTRTQQALLKAVAAKALSKPQNFGDYINMFSEYCTTDMTIRNMIWLADSLIGINIEDNVHTATLPGNGEAKYNGISYCYELYKDQTLNLVNELLNPYLENRTAEDLDIFSTQASVKTTNGQQ